MRENETLQQSPQATDRVTRATSAWQRSEERAHPRLARSTVRAGAQSNCSAPSSASTEVNEEAEVEDEDEDEGDEDEMIAATSASATPAIEILGQNIFVPPPQLEHESWDAWFAHLQQYMTQTNQVIRVREVVSCSQRNKRLANSKAARRGAALERAPESWVTYQRTYICTHGWKVKERGSGLRQRRRTRCTDCPFRFLVQLVHNGGAWRLAVRCGTFQHNHTVDSDTFGAKRSFGGRLQDEAAEVRTRSEKYSAALRAMRPITTELANIESDSEFDECLAFLLDQWHTIRQRKRSRIADGALEV